MDTMLPMVDSSGLLEAAIGSETRGIRDTEMGSVVEIQCIASIQDKLACLEVGVRRGLPIDWAK